MTPALQIDPPAWLNWSGVRAVTEAIPVGCFVGGVVRDTLLGRPIGDIDFASPLPPEDVIAVLDGAGIKTIPTGLDHGTVTAISGGRIIEITMLRRDVETDGRHAKVAFTDDWAEDAARRDFTMNALYLGTDGAVYDPTGTGIADCKAGRVRFIGEPAKRLSEDFLRLLRFYRFHAHYGQGAPDEAARDACRKAVGHLANLADERVTHETLKLLRASDPTPTIKLMIEDGVLPAILPPPFNLDRLSRLIEVDHDSDPILRLAALAAAPGRLRLSNKDSVRLTQLWADDQVLDLTAPMPVQRRWLYRLGAPLYRDRVLRAAVPPIAVTPLLDQAATWVPPVFPINGHDVIALGIAPGEKIGILLREIEDWWIGKDFVPDREACLVTLRGLINVQHVSADTAGD